MAVRTPGSGLPARPRLLAPVIAVVAVVLIAGAVFVSIYTDLLWYREVGFSKVFVTVLWTKVLLFFAFGLVMALLVGSNIAIAYRLRPPFRPMSLEQQNLERYRVAVEPFLRIVLVVAGALFGLFAGLSAASHWQTWLLWRHATSFGQTDPQFHRDISYYAMTYPFQRFVLGFLLTAVILSLLAAAATHYLFGGLRLQTAGDKVSPGARAHLSVLLGVVVLLKAVAYWLDRYGLAFSLRGVVQGASYTDVHAVLPAKTILVGIAVICALLFFANIVVRNVLLPAGALALLVVSAVVIGGVYPAYTQQFRVKPNEVQRESPYIQRNIEATRAAYGIADAQIEQYAAKTDVSQAALRGDVGTIPNARLLDPNVLGPTFAQFQSIKQYYGFNSSLDIDRYTVGGDTKDYIVAARELEQGRLSTDQRNWINLHLTYTHGNGFVAAPANTFDASTGRPIFAVGNIPPSGPDGGPSPIVIDQPRIYYGEQSPDYSIVDTSQAEIDGPAGKGDAQATNHYDGNGGIKLDSTARKLLFALKFREKNFLLSNALKSDAKLMYIREPRARVQKVAPFLTLDKDPYPAVVGGRILWIVDGYTTSSGYPYAQQSSFGDVTADSTNRGQGLAQRQVNYIRNSVKATVDAYTGKVTLYTWDEQDPVLKTWAKVFPGVLTPKSKVSPELESHFRYPEDLFKVQREVIAKYHVLDPKAFFNKADFWDVPADPATQANTAINSAAASTINPNASGPAQPPYYAVLQLPGVDAKPSFSLTTSFVARGNTNLSAFAAVSSDPGSYGKIRVLQVPRNTVINGPGQVASLYEARQEISSALSLLRQGGSQVILGNLLTLPVGGGLLYLEPVYTQASSGLQYPLLQDVIVSFGDKIVFQPTLSAALDALFGKGASSVLPSPGPSASPAPTPVVGDLAAAIAAADAAFRAGQEALKNGDFAGYGRAQQQLQAALQRLSKFAPQPSASASASPR
ncbi:MAG: hypothetical protein JWO88_1436 [Frankiales bacterium]|nr:hypothetical protein [Frankiales bacterium]